MVTQLYRKGSDGVWRSPGRPDLITDQLMPFTDENPPWALQPGEALDDGIPDIDIKSYTAAYQSGDGFGQVLARIRTAASAPYIVELPADELHITDFSFGAGTAGYGKGYQDVNGTKRWDGLIGPGVDQCRIIINPSIMTSTQYNAVSSGSPSPVQVGGLFFSEGNSTNRPTFLSGFELVGGLQQTISLSGLSGTAPAPYYGMQLNYPKPGSRIQNIKTSGAGMAALNYPPYEMGAIQTAHGTYLARGVEVDGRLPADIDPTRPRTSGGFMLNYETAVTIDRLWLHHTRRSSLAQHDHSPSEGGNTSDPGTYDFSNVQIENAGGASDSWAGGSSSFSVINVEEIRQWMTITNSIMNQPSGSDQHHIGVAISAGNQLPTGNLTVVDPVITNSAYNGCLVIGLVRKPGGGSDGPLYTLYTSSGLGALPFVVTQSGSPLTPVLSTAFNSGTQGPETHYVVKII